MVSGRWYLDDGIWGIFLSNLFEPGPRPFVARVGGGFYPDVDASNLAKFTLWGPTCDVTDCIEKSVELPEQSDVDEWLYFPNMGGKWFSRKEATLH